jgi:hypothetical protein
MLQVFHLDVAKVDLNVSYTCMLQTYVFKCFRCFVHMLQMFHVDVAYVCNGYTCVFQVFLVFYKCFRRMLQMFQLFECMLQVFHLDVVEVDLVLHMLQ